MGGGGIAKNSRIYNDPPKSKVMVEIKRQQCPNRASSVRQVLALYRIENDIHSHDLHV